MPEETKDIPSGRTSTYLSATVQLPEGEFKAFIRNLSPLGALIECDTTLAPGVKLSLERGDQHISGAIAWAQERTYGVKFDSAVDPSAWLREEIEERRSEVSLAEISENDKSVSDLLMNRISEEMGYAVRLIENSAYCLSKDAIIGIRYPVAIQQLDLAAQIISELSRIIASDNLRNDIPVIASGPMRSRLLR